MTAKRACSAAAHGLAIALLGGCAGRTELGVVGTDTEVDGSQAFATGGRHAGSFGNDQNAGRSGAAGDAGSVEHVEYVLVVTVDGLAPRFLDELLDAGQTPTFRRLQALGSYTHNARSDYTHTVTLPNHTSILTGRPVLSVEGYPPDLPHGYVLNSAPTVDMTLHNSGNPELDYVNGMFDVAHDRGLTTCLFAGKDKFAIFEQSWNDVSGAPDSIPPDDGRGKIDVSLIAHNESQRLVDAFVEQMEVNPCHLTLLHFTDTDPGGHEFGWGSEEWLELLRRIDSWLATILYAISSNPHLRDTFALILTADHGGTDYGHSEPGDPRNYTVPFYIVAPGFGAGTDLYTVFGEQLADPGEARPSYTDPEQPLRNGNAANLALSLLGLPQLEGSLMRDLDLPGRP